jgi:hypothetical protein
MEVKSSAVAYIMQETMHAAMPATEEHCGCAEST